MGTYKGLIYMKHLALGSRNEGPDYWLQTIDRDYQLHKTSQLPQPDLRFDPLIGHIVEIAGNTYDGGLIEVDSVRDLHASHIPNE